MATQFKQRYAWGKLFVTLLKEDIGSKMTCPYLLLRSIRSNPISYTIEWNERL